MELQEYDSLAGMLEMPQLPELANGQTLERFGKTQAAEMAYLECLRNEYTLASCETLEIVQERWRDCARNLKRWNVLFEYGKMNHDLLLLLDCYGKCNIWKYVSDDNNNNNNQ